MFNSKGTLMSKDAVFDLVLNLKMVAKESKHPRAGYYNAVFQALREKMNVPDEHFKDYIGGLLGNKDQEEVFKRLSQVDKATRTKRGRDSSWGMTRMKPYDQAQCYYCNGFGHYQRNCYARMRGEQGRGQARGQGPRR